MTGVNGDSISHVTHRNYATLLLTRHSVFLTIQVLIEKRDSHRFRFQLKGILSFSSGSARKEPASGYRRHRDVALIPGSGRLPGEGNGNPLM